MISINTKVFFSSSRDDWGTPPRLYNALHREFNFTLDPCADDSNHKCENYFTVKQNGLTTPWGENQRVFMNPPYGRASTPAWVKRAWEESQRGKNLVVCLLPGASASRWWRDYVMKADQIRFVVSRIRFVGATNCAPFASVIAIYYGNPHYCVHWPQCISWDYRQEHIYD